MYYIFDNNGICKYMSSYQINSQELNKISLTIKSSPTIYDISRIKLVNNEIVELEKEITLEQAKSDKIKLVGSIFADKRDCIRWVECHNGNTYGFDCANEDIVNFLASWKSVESNEDETSYKVWLTSDTKGLVQLNNADFNNVYNTVRQSQFEAYLWYESIKSDILKATTKEELNKIVI